MIRVVSLLIIALLVGCGPSLQEQADQHQIPPLHEETTITVTVHIIGAYRDFPQDALAKWTNLQGCAYPNGQIFVLGNWTAEGVKVDMEVLGHEVLHILHWQNPAIRDPDEY